MGLFDKFKKKPKPCAESEMKYILFKVGKDWEFYKYDVNLGIAHFWSASNGDGPDKESDEYKPEDIEFEQWPFINNASTEIISARDAFTYLL